MNTDPHSLHDAMRRLQVLLDGMRIDVREYIDADDKRSNGLLQEVLASIDAAEHITDWVRQTFARGQRREV
jgi:hypothetical protein